MIKMGYFSFCCFVNNDFILSYLNKEWIRDKESRGVSHKYTWNKHGFDNIDPISTDYVLGKFKLNCQ